MRGQTSGPNPLGPLIAGIIMTTVVYGRVGLREYFGRLVRCRVGIKWYAITLLMPILLCLLAVGLTLCFLPHSQISALSVERMREVPERFVSFFVHRAGRGTGWRGFALPQLQTKHSPLIASLLLAPTWALWHLPLIGNEFPWPIVFPFALSVFGVRLCSRGCLMERRGVCYCRCCSRHGQHCGCRTNFPTFLRCELVLLWWTYGLVWLCAGFGALFFSAKQNVQPVLAPVETTAA